jgi:hypothetical protein
MAKEGLQFEFSASTAEYRKAVESMPRDLQKAADQIEDIGEEINLSMSKAVGRGLVQGLAGAGVVMKLREVIGQFDQLSDAAKRFGASAEDIQRIDVAARQSGASLDLVGGAMEEAGVKANKAAREGGKLLEAFDRAGIDAAAFASAGLAEKIEMVGSAQAAAAGDSQRMADITEALGQSVGRVDFATITSGMKDVSVLSDGMVDALSRSNDALNSFDRGLNLAVGGILAFVGEQGFQRATSAIIGAVTQDFSIFGKTIEELKAMTEGLPPLFDKTRTSVDGASESTVNYSDVIKQLITVNAEMEASMARMEKGAGALGAQLAEAELKLAELSQQFAQSGDAEVFKEIQKTAKEILSLRQQTAKEEEKIRSETAKTSEEYRKQADAQARAIMSLDEEIQMLEAKLSGNEALTEELQRQQDFREAFEKTGNVDQADKLAGLRARERQMDGAGRGGSGGGSSLGPVGARLPTENERVGELRGGAAQQRADQRAAELANAGMFRSAIRAQDRGQRAADRAMDSARMRDMAAQFDFAGRSAGNVGEAMKGLVDEMGRMDFLDKLRETEGFDPTKGEMDNFKNALEKGAFDAQRDFERDAEGKMRRMADEQSKTPDQRKREEEEARSKSKSPGGGQDQQQQAAQLIYNWLTDTFFTEFKERLPQSAMTPN